MRSEGGNSCRSFSSVIFFSPFPPCGRFAFEKAPGTSTGPLLVMLTTSPEGRPVTTVCVWEGRGVCDECPTPTRLPNSTITYYLLLLLPGALPHVEVYTSKYLPVAIIPASFSAHEREATFSFPNSGSDLTFEAACLPPPPPPVPRAHHRHGQPIAVRRGLQPLRDRAAWGAVPYTRPTHRKDIPRSSTGLFSRRTPTHPRGGRAPRLTIQRY